jgi:peroxiredoxin
MPSLPACLLAGRAGALRRWIHCFAAPVLLAALPLCADEPLTRKPIPAHDHRIPRTLLPLIHSAEAQRELGIKGPDLDRLEGVLRNIDTDWLRIRKRWETEIHPLLDRGTEVVLNHLRESHGEAAIARLHQLELQAQGPRALLRAELINALELTTVQVRDLGRLFETTDDLQSRARMLARPPTPPNLLPYERARARERSAAERILTPEQNQRWVALLGPIQNTAAYERVHPLAPATLEPGAWLNGTNASLAALRGRVVVVLFYSFQDSASLSANQACNRWHRRFANNGLSVIGIQSPKVDAERDYSAFGLSILRDRIQFPVLLDADKSNWDAWGNDTWPTLFLIDRRGYIRGWWSGGLQKSNAGGEARIEQQIRRLLAEPIPPPVSRP